MSQKFTKGPKGTGVVEVALEEGQLEPFLAAAAKHLAQHHNFPGFRPGQAPRKLIEERLGGAAILEEAIPAIVRSTLPTVLDDLDVEIVGEPKIEITQSVPGMPFTYRAQVAILPHVSLPQEFKLKSRFKDAGVESADIEAAMLDLRRMRAKENPVTRAAAMGDKLEVDVDVFVDKVPIEGGQSRNHPILLGEGHFIPGFEEKMIGATVGETKEFQLPFPKDYRASHLQGKRGDFKVKINRVLEVQLPEVNDEFAKSLGGFANVQAVKDKLAENIKDEAQTKAQQRFELALIDELIALAKFGEIPDMLTENELGKMLAELRADIEGKGMKWEDYLSSMKRTEEDLKKELLPQALRRVKTALLLRTIAARETLDVPDSDVDREMQAFATRVGPTPELAAQIKSGDFRRFVKNTLLTQVVLNHLKKKATDAVHG